MENPMLVRVAAQVSAALREQAEPEDHWQVTTEKFGALFEEGGEPFWVIFITLTRSIGGRDYRWRQAINPHMVEDAMIGARGVVGLLLEQWHNQCREAAAG